MKAQDSGYNDAARSHWRSAVTRNRILFFLVVLLLAGSVRLLTFNFLRNRLDDPAWFQRGTYAAFEERAVAVLNGKEAIFWVNDPSRTDAIFFPPGYSLMIAAIFRVTGQRSVYAVQAVQTVIDLFVSLVFITGLAVTAFGLRAGMWASVMTAFSPLLAFVGASPFSDAPTAWFVIGGMWLLVLALKKDNAKLALGAGVVLGCACWLRLNPLYLSVFLAAALLAFAGPPFKSVSGWPPHYCSARSFWFRPLSFATMWCFTNSVWARVSALIYGKDWAKPNWAGRTVLNLVI